MVHSSLTRYYTRNYVSLYTLSSVYTGKLCIPSSEVLKQTIPVLVETEKRPNSTGNWSFELVQIYVIVLSTNFLAFFPSWDPDPIFSILKADPDPGGKMNVDPDPGEKMNVDPDGQASR